MCSCATQKVFNDYDSICGNYYGKNKYNNYYLTINKDSTFLLRTVLLSFGNIDINSAGSFCRGTFDYEAINVIFLRCNTEESITFILSDGYMHIRQRYGFLLKNNKIQLDNVILKKTEETDSK